jgi:hypothetical protein
MQNALKRKLHLPGPDFIDRIFLPSDRPARVLVSLQQLLGAGRLAGQVTSRFFPSIRELNIPPALPLRESDLL